MIFRFRDIEYRNIRFIKKKLAGRIRVKEIEKLKRLPKGIKYVTWSIGTEAEVEHSYRVIGVNNEEIYCSITTFLNLLVIQSKFFIKSELEFNSFVL